MTVSQGLTDPHAWLICQGHQKWCYSLLSAAGRLADTMADIWYYYCCCCFLYGLQNCMKFARLITRRVIGTHRYNFKRKKILIVAWVRLYLCLFLVVLKQISDWLIDVLIDWTIKMFTMFVDALTWRIWRGRVTMVTASASWLRTMSRTEANITMTLSESIAHLYTGKHQYQRKYTGVTIPQPEGTIIGGCPGHSNVLAIFAAAVAAAFAAKWAI